MKKGWVIGAVVSLHVIVVGALVLVQGCGTMRPPVREEEPAVVMPPAVYPPADTRVERLAPPVDVAPVRPAMEPKTYVVKSGDSLSRIAQRFNVTQRDLTKMNNLSDPNKIRVGQKLALPGYVDLNAPEPTRRAVAKPAAKVPGPAAVASGEEYVVKAGDSLSVIAKNLGTTTRALREVNGLTGDKIIIGQKLKVPRAADSPAPAPMVPAFGEPAPLPPAAPAVEAGGAPAATGLQHMVEQGEDLNSIAMLYSVRVEELMKANGLTKVEVAVGQVLVVPLGPADM